MEVEELLHLYKKFYHVLMGNRNPEKKKVGMLERESQCSEKTDKGTELFHVEPFPGNYVWFCSWS